MMRSKGQFAVLMAATLAAAGASSSASTLPPTFGGSTDLVLSLDASNYNASSKTWTDSTTSANVLDPSTPVQGETPTLGFVNTNNGSHAVVQFSGSNGLNLSSTVTAALSSQTSNLDIFVVGNTAVGKTQAIFLADYHNNGTSNGYATGI